MPPKIKTTREDILSVAMDIIRADGWENINARDIAKQLKCSTQPIFREFENMNELKEEVRKMAWETYNSYLRNYQQVEGKQGLSFGIAYVKFAKEEKNLFKLIFMSNEMNAQGVDDLSQIRDDRTGIIDIFMKITGLNRENSTKLHFNVWIAMHGLASMLATNKIEISDDEIKNAILNNFNGYLKILKEQEAIS
ncbi:MAG: TetR/AcrR family transcriptional regulator [Oscillospiraceae bacterium]